MDRLLFDKATFRDLAAVPAAAHQEHVGLDVLRVAWRRRRLIACIALGAALAAIVMTLQRAPRYTAEAIVALHLGRPDPANTGDSSAGVVVEAASIVLGEARILRSRVVARGVVDRLGLADDPGFSGEGLLARLTRHLGHLFSGETAEQRHERHALNAERALMSGLSIETDNRSYLISVTFSSGRPDVAARIANATAEEYLTRRLESSLTLASRNAEWLSGQAASTESRLQAAEAEESVFREQSGLLPLGAQGDSLRSLQLREFSARLNATSLARIAEEGRLARIQTLAGNGAAGSVSEFQAMPAVQAAAQREAAARRDLADLRTRLGPKHPAMQQAQSTLSDAQAALSHEIEDAVVILRSNVEAARASEQELHDRIDALQHGVLKDTAQESKLRNLQAATNALRERVLSLNRARDQALGLRDLRVVPASLIVPAQIPGQPAGPSPVLIILLALAGGLVAGVSLAALLERLDRGLRTSGEVAAATELRCLGLVPELPLGDALLTVPDRPALSAAQVRFDEAIRLVASSVGLFGSGQNDGGRVVLVTSAVPDEGRSVFCAGLARSLALSGRRVLLIDGPPNRFNPADQRKPAPGGQTRPAEPPEQAPGNEAAKSRGPAKQYPARKMPGVASTGITDASVYPQRSSSGALVVLHRGSATGLSFDVFNSPRLGAALDEARLHFDIILLEGPPVMLVADGLVLGRMADTVLHVARWADTKKSTVRSALRRMRDHGVHVDGVVLTRVDVDRHADLGLADQESFHLRPQRYYELGARLANARLPAAGRE